jgi:ketosteroid isomerase-like protein
VAACARGIAAAIGKRDTAALKGLISSSFVHRTPGGASVPIEPFLQAIEQIPGEILSVNLEHLIVDQAGDGAIATGIQHAQVRVDGQVIDDRRAFVDWFVREADEWRLRLAAELPGSPSET